MTFLLIGDNHKEVQKTQEVQGHIFKKKLNMAWLDFCSEMRYNTDTQSHAIVKSKE